MGKNKVKIQRKIYPNFENITPESINKSLERFKISMDFLFDDGIEFTYDSTLDVRYFPGDISFINKKNNVVILSYLEGFSNIEFYIGGEWDDETEPFLKIPIYDFLAKK